jgi:uncharacterized protein YgiM (DUF1202 family)
MRSSLRFLVIAVLVGAAVSGLAAVQGTLTRSLNLRSEASRKGAVVAVLPAHTTVTVVNATPSHGYLHVTSAQQQDGWVLQSGVVVSSTSAATSGSRALVRKPQNREKERVTLGMAAAACAQDLASCSATGCSAAGTPHALANQLKQTVPAAGTATMLTFDDFAGLQQQADNLVGEDQDIPVDSRAQLQNLTVSNGTVNEGSLVTVLAYLVGTPHPNTGESVNCNLQGETNNDFHIPISNDPNNSDFQGVVAEMIPQNRPDAWSLSNLTQVEANQQLVMITGGLFYDNYHKVNGDPNNPLGGQPHRFALWEVHPITQFMVCGKSDNSCDPMQPGDWVALGGGQ